MKQKRVCLMEIYDISDKSSCVLALLKYLPSLVCVSSLEAVMVSVCLCDIIFTSNETITCSKNTTELLL